MQPQSMVRSLSILCVLSAVLVASGQAVQHVARVDSAGAGVQVTISDSADYCEPASDTSRGTNLWHYYDAVAIAESVCLADTVDDTWVGFNLNAQRLSYFRTAGNGTPVFEYSYPGAKVYVASAEDASLGVASVASGAAVVLYAFSQAGGSTPLWSYTFDPGYINNGYYSTDVSADGAVVAGLAWFSGSPQSMLVILDGATGQELRRLPMSEYVTAVELSDDGSRAALTVSNTCRVVETAGLTTLCSFTVSGSGGVARLSRDGKVAAAGGFNYRAYKDTGSGWVEVWYGYEANQWFGSGLALSGAGDILFAVSHNYASGYLVLTYRVIDLVGQVELARITTSGSGSLQDSVQRAQASANGRVLAVASWGTQNNVHPEVQVFDRALNLIGSIDFPGSPFSLDLSRSGQYVVAGGKHVHANITGKGADVYAYEVFKPGDLNCDGVVNFGDINPFVLALSDPAGYAAQYPNCPFLNRDINGDGVFDFGDINPFVALLSGGL